MRSIKIGYSPCPNDTFIFFAWAKNLISSPVAIEPILADVEKLNSWALLKKLPITKGSISTLAHILDDYFMLPVGAALGFGCGPKIIRKKRVTNKKIAVPGKGTTAYFLLNTLLEKEFEPVFCLYDEVIPLMENGVTDFGLIIHETRFTFHAKGFLEEYDLGSLWEERYRLPLPLGGIFIKRNKNDLDVDPKFIGQTIKQSIQFANKNLHLAKEYIYQNSIEKNPSVIKKHINLYVNSETLHLSSLGKLAIDKMLCLGREKNLFPNNTNPWLCQI